MEREEAKTSKRKKKVIKVKASFAAVTLAIGLITGTFIGYNLDDMSEKIELNSLEDNLRISCSDACNTKDGYLAELELIKLLNTEGYSDYLDETDQGIYLRFDNGEVVLPDNANGEMLSLADTINDKTEELYDKVNGEGSYDRDKEILDQADVEKENKRK